MNPRGDPWVPAFRMFQMVFCATVATIVSGAMAERTKFAGYLMYSIFISALIYWLEGLGFIEVSSYSQE